MIGTLALLFAGSCGALGVWMASSTRRSAKFLRQIVSDTSRAVSPAPVKPNLSLFQNNNLTLCWIGHSTVLMNFYGIWILTDPVFSDRVGISAGLTTIGPKRFIAPALEIEELPPVDVILLSHAHYDHTDLPSLRRLKGVPLIITAPVTTDILEDVGITNAVELNWGDKYKFKSNKGDLQITAFEVNHWGRRWPDDRFRGYNGYILRREDKSIIFGGDTAYTTSFSSLRSNGYYDIAIMPIGAYNPWIRSHCTPEQAVEMANSARAKFIIPVHHQTFRLSDEPMLEPIQRLEEALKNEPQRLALRHIGETFVCPKT